MVWDVQTAAAFGQTNHPTRAEGRHDRRAPQTSDTIHHERKCRHIEVRSNREFSARIDAAFETQKTRDEAKLGLVQVATRTLKLTAKAA